MKIEPIYIAGLTIREPQELFGDYQVTEEDLARYRRMIEAGDEERAIGEFVSDYMVDFVELYNAVMQRYLQNAAQGELRRPDERRMLSSIGVLTAALAVAFAVNFRSFTDQAFAPVIFDQNKVSSQKVQNAILRETLSQFETLTRSALAETEATVRESIRTLQREMIVRNQQIRNIRGAGALADFEISRFQEGLRQKYPEIFKSMDDGRFIRSRRASDGTVRRYKLSGYAESAIRTTLLNVDRTSVEVKSRIDGDEVLLYYLRDNRPLKTGHEREICKHILRSGQLLALTAEAGAILGIMTIEQARADGAMGPYCRHSIKSLDEVRRKHYKKVLREARA